MHNNKLVLCPKNCLNNFLTNIQTLSWKIRSSFFWIFLVHVKLYKLLLLYCYFVVCCFDTCMAIVLQTGSKRMWIFTISLLNSFSTYFIFNKRSFIIFVAELRCIEVSSVGKCHVRIIVCKYVWNEKWIIDNVLHCIVFQEEINIISLQSSRDDFLYLGTC